MSQETPSTMVAAFRRTVAERPHEIALRTAGGGPSYTWSQYAERVARIAGGLAAAGVRHGDPVALLLTNRPEFHFFDTAAQHLGAVPFSCYNTSSPEQVEYLLAASGATVAVTEHRLAPAFATSKPQHLILADEDFGGPGLDLSRVEVAPGDLLTLVYTSGTTGRPKGVEITHANMVAMVGTTVPLLDICPGDRMISFLPAAHIADRWASHYTHLWAGTELTTLDDHRQIVAALTEVRPTLFGGVPQVWLRLVAGIRGIPELAPALDLAVRSVRAHGAVPPELEQGVLAPLRVRLGLDQVRVAVTAAAPAPPEIIELVNAIGVPLIEGWGMSEVAGLGTLVPPGEVRTGTIGLPLPGLETRLLDDGELLVRGPTVTRGYRDLPDETAAALDADGWLHTGDVARQDPDGYLRIIDRKKELLITTGGKNIAPSAIELTLRTACPLIAQAVVVGDGREYLTALVVIDPETGADPADPAVVQAVADAVAATNATVSRPEQIKAYEILPDVWIPGGDMVTPTMKVRRHAVLQRYAAEVEALYAR
ncbi:putative fatty-acid-CoA ligase FadD [Paractinoplanes abujensis]|uniref:Long-subunit acyl-CoA synthetase (AMP-forming) n=1 Tax=Paractinoplanes abujensis TaxID=882441 RepID=A0A7W7G2R1_9ACTN|nr:AMP-binding protein [Actinoplanes abujensis]MBB4691901.1 long-subunit acyl-CoA synthetase (AMP-forming) [Actinoplanes abujensis]GID16678.1 putative fatty-acid-CoA ligase FadD [Actinoplanes abujensis]